MSYTSSDPENFNRDPDTSSLASTSTVTASDKESKKKKPWSKFKSGIKTLGEKMSSKPKFTDPTESSEQKRVKKSKKGKSGEPKPSTTEEPTRAKSPTKNLMKKLSVESLSTPFVGYQPASVNPSKSYAKALHKSGSTSESNLSASDIDTPKKSLTLDRNLKLAQESPDSGRASQTMGSLEGSRPPSSIKEVASDVSGDSDYTSPRHGVEEEVLGELVTKTEKFAQSLVSPKGKEQDTDVTVEFLKAETASTPKKSDSPEVSGGKTDKASSKTEAPSEKDNKSEKVSSLADQQKVGEDTSDGRKKKDRVRDSKKEDGSLGLIASEQSTSIPSKPADAAAENKSNVSTSSKPEEKQTSEKNPVEDNIKEGKNSDKADVKDKTNETISSKPKEKSTSEKNTIKADVKEGKNTDKASKDVKNTDTKAKSETKPTAANEEKGINEKPESKPISETKPETTDGKKDTSTSTKEEKASEISKKDDKPKAPTKSDSEKPTIPTPTKEEKSPEPSKKDDKPKSPSKRDSEKPTIPTPTKTQDVASPLTDVDPATSQSMSVEEKLQAFLSAEGWSGTIKDVPAKSSDGTQPDKRECLYKILVIGELGTGKTSIIKRYVHQFFSQHYRATIGVDFALKVLNWDQNTIIRLQLWDIAGQERFGNMTRVYYKEAVGAFIVFDVTRSATFDAVLKWKQDLDSKVQLSDGSHIPCVLLANKCDQQKEGIVNTPAKMDEYCKENNFSAWFETSAKENINIDEAAKSLVTQILQNDKSSQNGRDSARDGGKFPLDGKSEQDSKSCAC